MLILTISLGFAALIASIYFTSSKRVPSSKKSCNPRKFTL
jgi:hypothetical protein